MDKIEKKENISKSKWERKPVSVKKEFEILEHTADTGVIAYGKDLKEAFANAAKGMFSLITSLDKVEEKESRVIEINSSDQDSLLVDWLNELIFLFDVDNIIFSRFIINQIHNTSLKAVACGEKIDPLRHEIKTGIKAATYHMLKIVESETCIVQVIFDI